MEENMTLSILLIRNNEFVSLFVYPAPILGWPLRKTAAENEKTGEAAMGPSPVFVSILTEEY
jgi:hypothetical protein